MDVCDDPFPDVWATRQSVLFAALLAAVQRVVA